MHKQHPFHGAVVAHSRWVFTFVVVICTPSVCLADLGGMLLYKATGFEQATLAHFIVGNLLLGVVEAFLITCLFKTPKRRTYWLMVVANYVSALAYFPVARLLGSPFSPNHFVSALLVALILTLIIEAPFVFWCFQGDDLETKRWWIANGLAQVLSYGLLLGFYFAAPLVFSDVEIRTPDSMSAGPVFDSQD